MNNAQFVLMDDLKIAQQISLKCVLFIVLLVIILKFGLPLKFILCKSLIITLMMRYQLVFISC